MFLGIGTGGMHHVPNDAAVIEAMRANMTEPGIYMMPGFDMTRSPTEAEWAALTQKAAAGPTAWVVYNPTGTDVMSPSQLGGEFGSNLLGALVGALILSWSVPSFGKRVMIATFIGLAAWLSIDASYWNWYRFPTAFIRDELVEQVVGWFLSGIAMALVLKSRVTAP
jgi:hypothetical protein